MNAKETLRACAIAAVAGLTILFSGCQGLSNSTGTTTPPPGDITKVNHIIFMAQENRSFDTYFSQLPAYWAANGYPAQSLDVMPAGASNPGYNGAPNVTAYHFTTECMENLSPSWNESHLDWNLNDPTSSTPAMDGFVYNAANFAINENADGVTPPYTDTPGYRAMGYFDWTDIPYYYFLASNFATSDRWFSPVLDRTQLNRMYLMAATSHGYAYPPGSYSTDNSPIDVPTIFDALDAAGVSWKIYATNDTCTSTVIDPDSRSPKANDSSSGTGFCTYLTQFTKYATAGLPPNVVDASQFLTDAAAGTLPSVSFIEPGYLSGQDEHPSSGTDVQVGAAYIATLINGLMSSPSWKDSVFILTYDEAGGTYDHVPPQPMPSPDGIAPVDLQPTDACYGNTSAVCDFGYTGYRLPLLVISPFTKKNYVSHTVADYTAILKFIETRFNLQPLTQRDAAQMDMTEFFDFTNVPWATPPTNIPSQPTNGTCDAATLGYTGK